MMKSAIFLMIALMLAGCGQTPTTEESVAEINAKLPEGCSFEYLGNVYVGGRGSKVFLTKCDGRPASTSTIAERHGKRDTNSVIIQLDKIND